MVRIQLGIKALIAIVMGILVIVLSIYFIQTGFIQIPGIILNPNITNSSPSPGVFPNLN